MKKPRLALLLLLGLLLGLAVSGGGRSSESPTVAAASMQSACGDVVFPSLRGIPGTAIALAGLPTGWRDEDTFARLEVEGYDGLTPVYIELLGDGEAELVLPFHPLDAMGGGSGAVVIYNEAEEVACPPVAVTIEPLTPAPEGMGMGDMFDALQHSFTARAERFGFSKADLLAMDLRQSPGIGVDPVDPARNLIIGLAAGLQMLEGDGVADNGRSILSGTVSVEGEKHAIDPADLHLMEAWAYTSGFTGDMMDFLRAFSQLPLSPAAGGNARQSLAASLLFPRARAAGIPPLPQSIRTPAELDYWMEVRTYCTVWDNVWLRAPREMVGGALTAASLVPGVQLATGPVLLYLTVSQIAIDICSNLLPHRLTAFDVTADPGVHNEDSPASEGSWRAELTAVGKEWTLDWPTVLGAVPGIGKAGKVITKVARQFGENVKRAEPVIGWLQNLLFDVWGIHAESGPVTLQPLNPEPIVIDPRRPGEGDYIAWSIETLEGERPFAFNRDETGYILRDVGRAQVWVRTQPGSFQGEFAGGHAILEVKPIEVEISSPDLPGPPFYLEPGEELHLIAHVANADDPTVEWWTDGNGQVTKVEASSGEQTALYRAPSAPGRYEVTAESMTRTGLRDRGLPPRLARAEIFIGGLILIPGSACVEIGDSLELRAAYSFGEWADFDNLGVIVSGSNAGYVEGGVFHGVREGTVVVSVWDLQFDKWADDAVFTVLEECSGFSAEVSGEESQTFGGKCTTFFNNSVYMSDGAGNRVIVEFFPRAERDDLEDGEAEFVTFQSHITVPLGSSQMLFDWSTMWTEGDLGNVTAWGEWRIVEVEFPDGTTDFDMLFFLSGEFEAVLGNVKQTPQGLIPVETFVTGEFRGVTDGWGQIGYWEQLTCEGARP